MPINSDPPDVGDAASVDAADAEIASLAAAGRHGDAAERALAAGRPLRAAELFERIWEFGRAARAAHSAGDLPRALRDALEARDDALVHELMTALDVDDDSRRAALAVFVRQRRFAEAGPLAERLGQRDEAIDHYQRAGRDLDAARLLEEAGRDRDAGRLLERLIDLGAGADAAEAHLRLGRILARRMSHDIAARHLQEAAHHAATQAAAQRALIPVLAALGLRDAARDVLLEARGRDPSLPADIDAFLRAAQESERARPGQQRSDVVAGRYRLEKLLGSGGAGRVFLARDEVSGRPVAIKMFHGAGARGSPAYERFVREARIAGALRHPALVEVYDFSAEHGFLVMEHMSGGSLAGRLGQPMPAATVRRVALDLLAGLELAHHRGIVHRDVKPANIFFDARGNAKLGDFGVAHLLDLGQTQTGGLIGTLAYMAPEQITGANLTIAADFYSLGVTLFEAITGRLPFLGPDFVAQHLGEAPPLPGEVHAAAAPWDALLARLLRKSPTERHESIALLRRELDGLAIAELAPAHLLHLPRASRVSRPHTAEAAVEPVVAGERAPRYQFETPLGATGVSQLARAVDTTLNRSVILERFDVATMEEATAHAVEQRLFLLARSGGAFVQRCLSYDRAARLAVYEAPAGVPIGEYYAAAPPSPAEAARLLKRLARAVASLHEVGGAHGAISAATVLVDDGSIPTLLASGLGPPAAEATPRGDIEAIVTLLGSALRCHADILSIAATLGVPAAIVSRAPQTGEELYATAHNLEAAVLRAQLG